MQLHFEFQGQGEPLVILHGLFGSGDNWKAIARALADKFQVYLVDLRNHGRSPHADEMNYPVMAEDLLQFMAQQHLPKINLLGHSMGGKAAMTFALRHPDKIDRLVIVDITPRQYSPVHQEILDGLLALDLSKFQTLSQVEAALAPVIPEVEVRRFLLKTLKRTPEGKLYWQLNLASLNNHYHQLNGALPVTNPFQHPTLFVRGEKSPYIREEDAAAVREAFPNAEIHAVPGAGHWVHSESPEAFLRIVREFLLRKAASGRV